MSAADTLSVAPARRAVSLPLAGFLLAALAVALPILLHRDLPLVDLPNHIARLHIAATGGSGPLAAYYTYALGLVPNSATDLMWAVLGHPGSAVRFAQLVMAVYAVNMIAAVMVLARVVQGRWTLWPVAAALLVYNGPFFWGFQNYTFSMPFCLYGLALWLRLEGRGTGLRLAVFLPLAGLLYLMHFFAFAFLAVLVTGRELQTLAAGPDRLRGVLRRVVVMLPFVLPVAWLAVSILTAPPSVAGSTTTWGPLAGRLRMFDALLFAPNATGFPGLNLLGFAGLALLLLVFSRLLARRGPRLVLAPALRGPALALGALALVMPAWLNGVALVDIRAPVLVFAVLFAGTHWQGLGPRHARFLVLVLAALIAARGLAFDRFAARYEADVADLRAATQALPPGARVLPLRGPGQEGDIRFYHLQALLTEARDAFVPTLFQGTHALKLRPEWAAHAHPALFAIDLRRVLEPGFDAAMPVFAEGWQDKFTHALLMDPAPVADPRLQAVGLAGRFTLYRVVPGG